MSNKYSQSFKSGRPTCRAICWADYPAHGWIKRADWGAHVQTMGPWASPTHAVGPIPRVEASAASLSLVRVGPRLSVPDPLKLPSLHSFCFLL